MARESYAWMFAKSIFIFVCGVLLASFFMWSLIQGIILQLSGDASSPLVYYFTAWIVGLGAVTLYLQARALFHYAKISK